MAGLRDDPIHTRFRRLLRRFSQAEISRRTGIPQSSLSRYLNGQKVPADVCTRLVEGLGVRADWLLTGNGPMYDDALNESTVEEGAALNRLLARLASVSREARAELSGSDPELFRTLGERVDVVRELREHLSRDTRPILQELIEQIAQRAQAGEYATAESLLETCKRLIALNDEPDLAFFLKDREAFVLQATGRISEYIAARRQVVCQVFGEVRLPPQHQVAMENNLIVALRQGGYLREAHRLARAFCELHSQHQDLEEYWVLRVASGVLDLDCGDIERGVRELQESLPRVVAPFRDAHYGFVLVAHLFQGLVRLSEVISAESTRVQNLSRKARLNAAQIILRFAVGAESAEALAALQPMLHDVEDDIPTADTVLIHFPYLLDALTGEGEKPSLSDHFRSMELEEDAVPTTTTELERLVYATQLARLTSASAYAELVERSQRAYDDLDPDQELVIGARWVHHRNVLRLEGDAPEDWRARSREFFRTHAERGYRVFAEFAS